MPILQMIMMRSTDPVQQLPDSTVSTVRMTTGGETTTVILEKLKLESGDTQVVVYVNEKALPSIGAPGSDLSISVNRVEPVIGKPPL